LSASLPCPAVAAAIAAAAITCCCATVAFVLQHGWDSSDRTNAKVSLYAAAAREVSKQHNIPLLDVNSIFSQQGPQQLKHLLNDGVHFSAQGNQLVFKSLRELLETKEELAGLRTGNLPNHFPLFDQVDASNPDKTFRDLFDRQVVTPGGQQHGGPTQ
jgi:hypothetical protein